MSRSIFLLILCSASCHTETPATHSKAAAPVATSSTVVQKQADANISNTTMQPVFRVAVGQSIWLETVTQQEAAAARLVGEALRKAGGLCSLGDVAIQAVPSQPLPSWQSRASGIDRRVVIDAVVVLREGFLEHLLSRSEAGKDHESIMSAPFDAKILHAAMLGAGFKPGKPATFINAQREYDFKPATGDVVKLLVEYTDAQGKYHCVPAQAWVSRAKDNKPLVGDWVFAGSYNGKARTAMGEEYEYFGANDGRVICLTNFGSALLDLPFESVDSDPQGDNLGYKANPNAIPERGTSVRVIMERVQNINK
ncbi:MAG: hypothetical protein JNJ77_13085 [Planctomycetia bacterium]|nr:hypothetical protein [Planctomycetia bacterium]